MKGITYCGACADYDIKKHRCKRGAKLESNPQDKFFDDCPLPDAVPVVHGRWDDSGKYTFPSGNTAIRCTNCGCALTESEYRLNNWNYCPVCGAKMGGTDGK